MVVVSVLEPVIVDSAETENAPVTLLPLRADVELDVDEPVDSRVSV